MISHLNRKNRCEKCIESFKYCDEEIDKLSLIRKKDREIDEFRCNKCNKIYCNNFVLNKHIKEYCKVANNELNGDIINEGNTINIDKQQNNTNNTNNTYNITNNNIYILNCSNIPVPFDKDWNTEHIDLYLKQLLLLADNKYTDLLKKILENKNNLNVILDKKTNIGYVYNSNNEYQNMEKSDIINMSMEKLHNELNKMKDEIETSESKIIIKYNDEEVNKIDTKYNDYINNKTTQRKVEECISDIFDTKKDDAHNLFNNINLLKNNKNGY